MNEIQRMQQLAGIITEDDELDDQCDDCNDEAERDSVDTDEVNQIDEMMQKIYDLGKDCVATVRKLDSFEPEDEFPHWLAPKVERASEYLQQVRSYIERTGEKPEHSPWDRTDPEVKVSDEIQDTSDPSGVS